MRSATSGAKPEAIDLKDITVLIAVRNRSDHLVVAYDNWISLGFSSFVIVDWGSDQPVEEKVLARSSGPGLRIVRRDPRERWVLSKALNAGLTKVKTPLTIKLDADHVLSRRIDEVLPLGRTQFRRGHWTQGTPDQRHVNGALLAWTQHLHMVGGWDERIQSYGWEDSDLYERLRYLGLRETVFGPGQLSHLDHPDSARLIEHFTLSAAEDIAPEALIAANRALTYASRPWGSEHMRTTAWSPAQVGFTNAQRNGLDALIQNSTELGKGSRPGQARLRYIVKEARDKAQELVGAYWESLKFGALRKFLVRFLATPERIVVHPEHGLGNRMRAVASAQALAHVLDAELAIVWKTDTHMSAQFRELFDWAGEVHEMNQSGKFTIPSGSRQINVMGRRARLRVWNLMGTRELHIHTSKSLVAGAFGSRETSRFLQSLVPSAEVLSLLGSNPERPHLGIHVRNISPASHPHLGSESIANWSSADNAEINRWREKVDVGRMLSMREAILNVLGRESLPTYVSTDTQEARDHIRNVLKDDHVGFCNVSDGRGKESVQQALAEMLFLAQSEILLGSPYSSFTECAHRIAGPDQKLFVIGVDY